MWGVLCVSVFYTFYVGLCLVTSRFPFIIYLWVIRGGEYRCDYGQLLHDPYIFFGLKGTLEKSIVSLFESRVVVKLFDEELEALLVTNPSIIVEVLYC